MKWLQGNAAALVALVVVGWLAVALIRALLAARRAPPRPSVIDEFTRAEKIRGDIRRKIADRKANPVAAEKPTTAAASPVATRRPLLDPFGGPARRLWDRARKWLSRGSPRIS